MRQYYIASGILLLILPIIDFAVAAPVLVHEKGQVDVDVLQSREEATNMLGKRGDESLKLVDLLDDRFANLEDLVINPGRQMSGPTWSKSRVMLPPSTSEKPSTVSRPDQALPSSGSLTESGDKLDAPPGPSGPVKSTMSRLS
jgi:hypothetical protein